MLSTGHDVHDSDTGLRVAVHHLPFWGCAFQIVRFGAFDFNILRFGGCAFKILRLEAFAKILTIKPSGLGVGGWLYGL